MKKTAFKLLSIFLAITITCSFLLTACAEVPLGNEQLFESQVVVENDTQCTPPTELPNTDTSDDKQVTTSVVTDFPAVVEPPVEPAPLPPSIIPEGIDKDIFSYVYASLAVDLMSYGYDVFNAVAETDGQEEYGLAYCDYEEAYQIEGDEKTYLSTGFYSFSLNNDVNKADTTVFITPLDDNAEQIEDEYYGYISAFVEDGLPDGHFIANNKYVKYSVEDGAVSIETYHNSSSNYDLSLGTLYDYDKSEIVFVPYDDISSDPIEYVPLTETIDAQAIKDNLHSVIEAQEKNGYRFESITIAYISIDALNAFKGILSQNNSLNGYLFDELNSIGFDNATQFIHFNEDGSITIKDLPPLPANDTKSLLDWVVDGLVLAGAGAIAVVSIVFLGPAGGVIAGGVIGGGIEYFNQTVVQGKKFSEVNWSKVGIMSISGSLGAAVPCAGTLGFLASGAVGGLTSAAITAVDGGSWEDILASAAQGALTSMVMHGLFASCFPEGTPVLTKDGLLPIEAITVGTLVASYNIYTNQIEWQPVLETYANQADEFTKICLSDGSELISTSNHPYYEANTKIYISANRLVVGNELFNALGERVSIISIDNYRLITPVVVYNLNVDENHNYFVDEGYLVHNACNTQGFKNKVVSHKVDDKFGKLRIDLEQGGSGKYNLHLHQNNNKYWFDGSDGFLDAGTKLNKSNFVKDGVKKALAYLSKIGGILE